MADKKQTVWEKREEFEDGSHDHADPRGINGK